MISFLKKSLLMILVAASASGTLQAAARKNQDPKKPLTTLAALNISAHTLVGGAGAAEFCSWLASKSQIISNHGIRNALVSINVSEVLRNTANVAGVYVAFRYLRRVV